MTDAARQDMMFGLLGAAMMGVYAVSFIVRPKRCYFRLGIDSILTLLLYVAGAVMLAKMK